jgi:hypothetical protein
VNANEKRPTQGGEGNDRSIDGSAKAANGTEAAVKGGTEPAKRQAEHDWDNSSKESGE